MLINNRARNSRLKTIAPGVISGSSLGSIKVIV